MTGAGRGGNEINLKRRCKTQKLRVSQKRYPQSRECCFSLNKAGFKARRRQRGRRSRQCGHASCHLHTLRSQRNGFSSSSLTSLSPHPPSLRQSMKGGERARAIVFLVVASVLLTYNHQQQGGPLFLQGKSVQAFFKSPFCFWHHSKKPNKIRWCDDELKKRGKQQEHEISRMPLLPLSSLLFSVLLKNY